MKKTIYFKAIVLLLIFTLLLVACGNGDPENGVSANGDSGNGDTSEAADSADSDSSTDPTVPGPSETVSADIRLDPATVSLSDEDSLMLSGLVYDSLVEISESWTISEDKLDYVFILRPEAVFHDGTPITADDVAANFNRWFDPENELHGDATYEAWETYFKGFKGDLDSDGTALSTFDGIEKVDDRTVLIHLNEIVPDFLEYIAHPSFSILDPGALSSAGSDYGTSADSVNGSGAYKVAEWSDEMLVLEPFANYWGTPAEETLEFGFE